MAKKLSNFPDKFKASKGWYEKFTIRFNQKIDKQFDLESDEEMIIIET